MSHPWTSYFGEPCSTRAKKGKIAERERGTRRKMGAGVLEKTMKTGPTYLDHGFKKKPGKTKLIKKNVPNNPSRGNVAVSPRGPVTSNHFEKAQGGRGSGVVRPWKDQA